jgi:hypothetical protein
VVDIIAEKSFTENMSLAWILLYIGMQAEKILQIKKGREGRNEREKKGMGGGKERVCEPP